MGKQTGPPDSEVPFGGGAGSLGQVNRNIGTRRRKAERAFGAGPEEPPLLNPGRHPGGPKRNHSITTKGLAVLKAKWETRCPGCDQPVTRGSLIDRLRINGQVRWGCAKCADE